MKTKTVKIKDLYIDPKLTNLRHVNPVFVSRYRQAYRNEANMPLIIVQIIDAMVRVISGNHRATALREEYGEDHEVKVEVKEYASEREVLEDFAKQNATHGNPIDDFTKKKLTKALLDEGCTPENIAVLFNVSVKRIEMLGDDIVQVTLGNGEIEDRPAKKGFEPEAPISEVQYSEHANKDRGLTVSQQAGQLVRWLQQDLILKSDTNILALKLLKTAIDKYLSDVKKSKVKELA
jgi:hypothetical protein